jgi:hypothetical protein
MAINVTHDLPRPLLGECDGPILAMPHALTADIDISSSEIGMKVLQAACEAMSDFEVGGDPLSPNDAVMRRLDEAIAECSYAANALPGKLKTNKGRLYDATFGVARTSDAELGLAHGIGVGTRSMLNQLGRVNHLMPSARLDLIGGFAGAITALAPSVEFTPHFLTNPAMAELQPYDPLERWVQGHWLFFSACQVATIFHLKADAANAAGDQRGTEAAMNAAANAFRVISHGFSLAGDITPAQYSPIVEKMQAVRQDFSGLWFADHQMVKQLKDKVAKSCPKVAGSTSAHYVSEANFMYNSHSFVCSAVTGGERASLMGGGQGDDETGPSMLRRFAKAVLKLAKARID